MAQFFGSLNMTKKEIAWIPVLLRHMVQDFLYPQLFFLFLFTLFRRQLWASVFMFLPGITEFQTFEKSMYFSLVTFTTLGYGEITIGSNSRMLAGLEAINGITLIGWSTAFMFAIFQELIKSSIKKRHVN